MTCSHSHRQKSRSALKKTLVLVLIFMCVEFIFGWIANSLALMSDALHLFTDAGALALSLFAFWMSRRRANSRLTYGYHRTEILAALISGGTTWALSAFLIYEGILRLMHPAPVKGPIVLIVATIGLIANIIMIKILHPSQKESLNVRGAYVHILGDLLASVGVVIAGLLITLTHWEPIDPIVTFLISLIVIWSAWKLIKDTIHVLMEGAPQTANPALVEKDLMDCSLVEKVHDLHIWMLSEDQINLSVHICSQKPTEALKQVTEMLRSKYQIKHTTIQVEPLEGFACDPCPFQT